MARYSFLKDGKEVRESYDSKEAREIAERNPDFEWRGDGEIIRQGIKTCPTEKPTDGNTASDDGCPLIKINEGSF